MRRVLAYVSIMFVLCIHMCSGKEIGFIEALKKRAFLYVNMTEAIRMTCVSSISTHVMPYLSSLGVPRQTAGIMTGAIPLFSIIGALIGAGLGSLSIYRRLLTGSGDKEDGGRP